MISFEPKNYLTLDLHILDWQLLYMPVGCVETSRQIACRRHFRFKTTTLLAQNLHIVQTFLNWPLAEAQTPDMAPS